MSESKNIRSRTLNEYKESRRQSIEILVRVATRIYTAQC